MPFTLTTDRLILRKLGRDDLDALVELDSDPEVMRYINGGTPNSRALYLEVLLERMLGWAPDDPIGFYAALFEDQWIGWFHLKPSIATTPDDNTTLELGYRLRRAAWGLGLATEGSRALAGFAVDELAPVWLDGCAMPTNLASIAVLQKCGLKFIDLRMHPRVPIEVGFYRAAAAEVVRGPWARG